jgi:hypothetical protein
MTCMRRIPTDWERTHLTSLLYLRDAEMLYVNYIDVK